MTRLRQRMVEDMKIRHFSPQTRYRYILAVEKFAQHFDRSPERLGREQVREFLVYMHETGASYAVMSSYVSALRFLYRITLRRSWTAEDIPFPRQPKHLPSIPTREEIPRPSPTCVTFRRCWTNATWRSKRAPMTRLQVQPV